MAQDVEIAAKAFPQEKFITMDLTYDQPYANVWTEIYAIDQAGFLAGYVAAAVTKTGKVGTYGGYNYSVRRRFHEWLCLRCAVL